MILRAEDLKQLEAERFDPVQHTEERRLVGQLPGEQGLGSPYLSAQLRKRAQQSLAQPPADADLIVHGDLLWIQSRAWCLTLWAGTTYFFLVIICQTVCLKSPLGWVRAGRGRGRSRQPDGG